MFKPTTIAALIVVASVAPSFAVPVKNLGHKIQTGVEIGNGLVNAAQGLKQVITGHQRRELEDILARMYELEARDNENELFERGVEHPNSESGALNFKKLIGGAAKLFLRDEDELMARDDIEDLATRDEDLVARKITLGHVQQGVQIGNGLIGAAQGLKQVITGHQRRELEDLIARMEDLEARGEDASGALNFGKIFKGVAKGAAKLLLRENDEFLARDDVEDLVARDDDLVARKVTLNHIEHGVQIGNGLINAAQGLKQVITGHQRRELEDLIARMEEIEARGGDASGALNFGKIFKGVAKGAAKLLLREEDELLARSPFIRPIVNKTPVFPGRRPIIAREPFRSFGHGPVRGGARFTQVARDFPSDIVERSLAELD